MRNLLIVISIILIFAISLSFFIEKQEAQKNLSDIGFYGENQKLIKVSDFKGKKVLLNLWATWCTPCIKEMPDLNNLQRQNNNIKIIALSIEKNALVKIAKFYQKHQIDSLDMYYDKDRQFFTSVGATGLPYSVLFDESGQVIRFFEGVIDFDELGGYL